MSRDDVGNNGTEPNAVRVLPMDGIHPLDDTRSGDDFEPSRKWRFPVLVSIVLPILFLLFATSRGDRPEDSTIPPQAISAVDTEFLDLTRPEAAVTTADWVETPRDDDARLTGMFALGGTMVTYGATDNVASAWLSSTGSGWRDAQVETPDRQSSRIDHAVLWDGGVVALGTVDEQVGLWTANSLSRWMYQGVLDDFDGRRVVAVVAGDELLAITFGQSGWEGWTSADGLGWTSLGYLPGLADLLVMSVAAHDGWYFAAGEEMCQGPRCPPALYRSSDGLNWLPAAGFSSDGIGAVVDIAATADGLLAVGWVDPSADARAAPPADRQFTPGTEIAMWESADGVEWLRVGEDELLLKPQATTFELVDFDTSQRPVATVAIDGVDYRLAVGSHVGTDAGVLEMISIGPTRVAFEIDGAGASLVTGDALIASNAPVPTQIVSQGPRRAITGWLDGTTRTPAVWTSADDGATWNMEVMEPGSNAMTSAAAMSGSFLAVAGLDNRGVATFWNTTWDSAVAETAGIAEMERYLRALAAGYADGLITLLPANRNGTVPARFQIPSLGKADLEWWDPDTGTLVPDTVAETVAYLEAMHTEIEYSGCVANMHLGSTDDLRVACDFEVRSALLAALQAEDNTGQVTGRFENRELRSVIVSRSPSSQLWDLLAEGTGRASAADRATLGQVDDEGIFRLRPTFDSDSAASHLRLAAAFGEGLLRPGETLVVDTPLGIMEWQWLTELPAPVYSFDWIGYGDPGFMASARAAADSRVLTLWTSPDGLDWTEIAAPADVEWMWNITPFGDGFAGQGIKSESVVLVYFDGIEWSEFDIPGGGEQVPSALGRFVTSSDEVLALSQVWSETEGGWTYALWVVDSSGNPRGIDLPEDFVADDDVIGVGANDDGFYIATSRFGQGLTIWQSGDESTWTQVADTDTIGNAGSIWNVELHGSNFFVSGDTGEPNCTTTSDGGQVCEPSVGMWSSTDGSSWSRLITAAGAPVAAGTISSGPLGAVAIGQFYGEGSRPRSVYLSPSATTWDQTGNLRLQHTPTEWWWLSQPAVGDDTIVIPGNAADPTSSDSTADEHPFLIIGRLVAPPG